MESRVLVLTQAVSISMLMLLAVITLELHQVDLVDLELAGQDGQRDHRQSNGLS
jgi:hypothetical protein